MVYIAVVDVELSPSEVHVAEEWSLVHEGGGGSGESCCEGCGVHVRNAMKGT